MDTVDTSANAPAPPSGAMLSTDFVDGFAGRLLTVWNEHNTTDLDMLLTPDVLWVDPALPEPIHGVAAVRTFMQDSWRAMPDLTFAEAGPRAFAIDQPVVMVPWRMTGTHEGRIDPPGYAPTGRKIDIKGVDYYLFRGEQVASYRAYYNAAEIARQLGILPSPGSRAEHFTVLLQRLNAGVTRRLRRG